MEKFFFTHHESWTIVHGLFLGSLYLLAFGGGLDALWNLKPGMLTGDGIRRSLTRIKIGLWTMAVTAWLTVITGTFIVYPWYRAKLQISPRSRLLADPYKAHWHSFGMEWKEHVTWMVPILATAAAFIATRHGQELAGDQGVRSAVAWLVLLGFAFSIVGGLAGALINKTAPFL